MLWGEKRKYRTKVVVVRVKENEKGANFGDRQRAAVKVLGADNVSAGTSRTRKFRGL
jgi:hypothetical protein